MVSYKTELLCRVSGSNWEEVRRKKENGPIFWTLRGPGSRQSLLGRRAHNLGCTGSPFLSTQQALRTWAQGILGPQGLGLGQPRAL